MNFSQALELVKENKQVARQLWKGQEYLTIKMPPEAPSVIMMKDTDGALIEWTPLQEDILAEDWLQVAYSAGI